MLTIKAVEDTRVFDFGLGRFIPGSGVVRNCDCCGAKHEIHVTLSDGSIVGSTCAKNKVFDSSALSTSSLKGRAIAQKIEESAQAIARTIDWNSIDRSCKENYKATMGAVREDIEFKADLIAQLLKSPCIKNAIESKVYEYAN